VPVDGRLHASPRQIVAGLAHVDFVIHGEGEKAVGLLPH
jgi:hypothetical protein